MSPISDFMSWSTNMIILFLDTLVRTRLWNWSTGNMPGPTWGLSSRTTASPVLLAEDWRLLQCHKPYGLLKQLPIFPCPWNSISMDFVKHLLPSLSFTAILVIVDRLTKQGIFVLTHDTITAAQLVELFILHIFSKHGVPSHVTSNRGSEFVSHFFQSLGKVLDMNLHFTSGYHLEGNGQMEHVNQTLEQYLSTATTSRATGPHFFCLQNSLTTILWAKLLVLCPSSPIRATTWIWQFTWNAIWLLPVLGNLLLTWENSMRL